MAKANPKAVNCKLVLTGGREGRTCVVGNIKFVDGVGIAYAPDHKGLEGVCRYMARSYQAYRVDSPQLKAYMDAKPKPVEPTPEPEPTPPVTTVVNNAAPVAPVPTTEGGPDGTGKANAEGDQSGGSGPVVHSGIQSGTGGSADETPAHGAGNDNASTDGTEHVPGGDGHEHAGVSGAEENRRNIQAAAVKLDPANDEHWTPDGLPKVDAIAQIAGMQALTRAEVESAIPGMTRPKVEG